MAKNPIALRLAIVAIAVPAGFVFPWSWLVAAFVAWTLVQDFAVRGVAEPDAWYARRWTVTGDDPNWPKMFFPFCESPAEVAFLKAMIGEFGLLPRQGILEGSGLILDLQVKTGPYRLDFLAMKWLAIEIDGAAYHSSPEAVANDRSRDQFLVEEGYAVLRIPARIALNNPGAATRRVREALAAGPPHRRSGKPARVSLIQALAGAGNLLSDLNDGVALASAVRKATDKARSTFDLETAVTEASLQQAKSAMRVADFCAGNDERARSFETFRRQLDEALPQRGARVPFAISHIEAPPPHAAPETDAAIQRAHGALMQERSRYFARVRQQILADHRLARGVEAALREMGYPKVWETITRTDS